MIFFYIHYETQLFVQMSHKNAALAFKKLNSYLQDIQEWMPSSMLKLNQDKTEFIVFEFNAQLKKLDSHLLVRLFGNFIHAAVFSYLGICFKKNNANFLFTDHVHNICKTCSKV